MANNKLVPTCYIVKNANGDTIKIPVGIAQTIIKELEKFSHYSIIQFEITHDQFVIQNHSSVRLLIFMPKNQGAKITDADGYPLTSTTIQTNAIVQLCNKL